MQRINFQSPKFIFSLAAIITISIFLLSFYATGFGVFGDGLGYYSQLRSLIFDGDFIVTNEYDHYRTTFSTFSGEPRWLIPSPTYSKYTIGVGLILAPFFFLGHILTLALQSAGFAIPADGFSWPYELIYSLGSLALGIAGLYLCYLAAKKTYGSTAALFAVIGVWFASSLFYYLAIVPSMAHALSQFLISAFLYIALTKDWKNNRRLNLLMGLTLGFAILVRPQNVFFCVVPVYLIINQWIANRKIHWQDTRPLFTIAAITIIISLAQVAVYIINYNSLVDNPYWTEGATAERSTSFAWFRPRLFAVLFSSFRGLFAWHPIILLAVIGLFMAWKNDKQRITAMFLAFAFQIYIVAAWHAWYGGSSMGARMFNNSTFIFVMGLSALWRRWHTTRPILILTFLFIGWNFLLNMQFMLGMIPYNEGLTFTELYGNQWRVISLVLQKLTLLG